MTLTKKVKADTSGDFVSFKQMVNGLNVQLDAISNGMQVIIGFELSAEELASNISEKKRRLGY